MVAMRIEKIAQRLGAAFSGTGEITGVVTDTRRLVDGCLFVALQGESFDGHDFVRQALAGGAAYAVVHRPVDAPAERLLTVRDTREALLQVANLYRSGLDVRIVGVTGSVGKTTTKEMIACALSARYDTLKTEANLNNEIGISWTMLSLEAHHRAAVLEMGMDGPGQIRPLSMAAQPDVAVVTNIGVSHLEALGSRENIMREKLRIADGLPAGAPLILCGDDDLLATVASDRVNILRYGVEGEGCAVRAVDILEGSTQTGFTVLYDEKRYAAEIPVLGRHNILNALAAFTVAVCLDVPPQAALDALRGYRPAGMRQRIVEHGGFTVVEDCYNASPDSMRAALATLRDFPRKGKRVAVLADMLELGAVEQDAHLEAGRIAARCADLLLCVGERARGYLQGAVEAGMREAYHFPDKEALLRHLSGCLAPGDVVWFKASRGMKLEDVLNRLYEEL